MSENLSKEETMSALITLRGGMSVIYDQMEHADSIQNKAENQVYEIENKISKYKSEIYRLEYDRNAAKKALDRSKTDFVRHKNKSYILQGFFGVILCLVVMAGIIAALAAGVYYFTTKLVVDDVLFQYILNKTGINELAGFFLSIAIYALVYAGAPALACLDIYLGGKKIGNIIEDASDFASRKKSDKKNYNISRREYEKFDDADNRIAELKNNISSLNDKIEILNKKAEQDSLPYIANAYSAFVSLKEIYEPVLAVNDWKYIDDIFWALYSGRADNLKEALKYADNERRTNKITEAIKDMSSQIQTAISTSMRSLNSTIRDGFEKVTHYMDISVRTKVLSIENSMTSTSAISNQLSNISSSLDFNNSLTNNLSQSTQCLSESVDRLIERSSEAGILVL